MSKNTKAELDLKKEGNEIAELRKKKKENEIFIAEIDTLNAVCYQLYESINYEKNKKESIQREIGFRKRLLEDLSREYQAVANREDPSSHKQLVDVKAGLIRENLLEILNNKIPEFKLNYSKVQNIDDNEFHDMIHDNIVVYYTQYDSADSIRKKEERQAFRISICSKFSTLKVNACQYWDIHNISDYVITDEAEAVLCDEDMIINDFMKYYSVRTNSLRLMHIPLIQTRTGLIGVQESRIRENNKFGNERKGGDRIAGISTDNSKHKLKEFSREYPLLRPFNLLSSDQKYTNDKKLSRSYLQAYDIETSFWMLVILALFFALTIILIYPPSRDIVKNNIRISYTSFLFNNTGVINYQPLFAYFIEKIGFSFIGKTDVYNETVWDSPDFPYLTNVATILGNPVWFNVSFDKNVGLNKLDVKPLMDYIQTYRDNAINFQIISSIHIINSRVTKKNCTTNPIVLKVLDPNIVCYNVFYDETTMQTEDLMDNIIGDIYTKDESQVLQRWISQMSKFQSQKDAGYTVSV